MNMQEYYINRCLQLAKKGLGNVAPNPMVGCVIVCSNKIIGEGYHQKYGEAHAEVNAINSVKDKTLLKKSTLYVNLEPCAHFGKTPPCSNLIIESEIPEVVIGSIDTFSKVAGKGIELLKSAGIKVSVGVLEEESKKINKRFFTYHEKKRPYLILKWAQTSDGFIDIDRMNKSSKNNWITTPLSKKLVHKWRSEEQSILIATNTAINDNPELNVREWRGKNPLRIVLDINDRLPKSLKIFDGSTPTLIFTAKKKNNLSNIEYVVINPKENIIDQILFECYKRNIQSIIIEGGGQLLTSFIKTNIWDEAQVFEGKKQFNKGLMAPKLNCPHKEEYYISSDKLRIYYND